MRMIAAALVITLFGGATGSRAAGVLVTGEGQVSCATWLGAPENHDPGEEWLLGFWSGMNVAHQSQVGLHTDRAGIVAEVEKTCAANPSELLLFATSSVWQAMMAEGR